MKRMYWILISILLITLLTVSVRAAPTSIADNANLLLPQEESVLADQLDSLSQKYGIDVVIVTTLSLNGKSAQDYADDYYNQGGYGEDGILLLVSMGYRDWSISAHGKCQRAFGDTALDAMEADVIPCLSSGDYAEAFSQFAQLCDETMQAYEAGPSLSAIVICLAIGIVIACIATGVMKGELKSVRAQTDAHSYADHGSFVLTRHLDLFMYRNITRRPRPQDSSGSHRSASGRSHGGRSGKF